MTPLERLKALTTEAATISSAASALGWDQETYLPPAAVEWRAGQLAWLSGRSHELRTSEAWSEALDAALADELSDRDYASLVELKRQTERGAQLPTELVERHSRASSMAKQAWARARETNDFPAFAPHLSTLLDIAREKAERWGYADEAYDALLETYERGASTASVSNVLDPLAPQLREIAAVAAEHSATTAPALPAGPYPVSAQQTFNREVAESLGFDFEAGRIDTTTHPFCTTLGPADVRLTTRYDEQDFTSSLFGVMHEAGHGLYEQGLAAEDFGTPAGSPVSLGIHESQSRLWENHVGRSRSFWEKWFPIACRHFPQLGALDLEAFLRFVRRSEFSFIRVESDEATYDLHILLRFGLERRLLRGELEVADVPEAWNAAFHDAFGITPPDDRRGCLQDIHWSMGALGYFPTYTLGNLNAAQLFEASMRNASISDAFTRADYGPLLAWMREKVHQPGSTLAPAEIIEAATGAPPSPEAHLRHLRDRYAGAQG